ncbi:Phosphate transport system permease protein PstC [Thiorhodovibrio winogradskyi]|uniref:Phosphate transport system permease protein PstC n=1 Tax=Thiorhodovibrio winogradskyi TaxID=77007 RepID=A0ABZ0SB68_9GAMM|nr:ABC transporter permease subunit [Thiorhodovibrio winogradskyi]
MSEANLLQRARATALLERRRDRSTRPSVLLADRFARWLITIGGLLVILAVVGIMVFLISVALPLAKSGETLSHSQYQVKPPKVTRWLNADEYRTLGVRISAEGAYSSFHLDTGQLIASSKLDFGEQVAISVGGVVERDQVAFGFADGSVLFAVVDFQVDVLPDTALPSAAKALNGTDWVLDERLYSKLPGEQIRRLTLKTEIGERVQASEAPIIALDYRVGGTAERPTRSFVSVDAEGIARLSRSESKINILTKKVTTRTRTSTLPSLPAGTHVTAVAMTTHADAVYVASSEGEIYRYDTRHFNAPTLAETLRVFPGETITSMGFLIGEQALVVGGSNGAVDVFFLLPAPADAGTTDGNHLVRARRHAPHGAAVTNISVSQRSKALVTTAANGEVWLRHSTSDQVLERYQSQAAVGDAVAVQLMPRVDGVLLLNDSGGADFWRFHHPHPEVTLGTVFGKVWYEGYVEPSFTWQSSSGTDVFEPKFSLIPLMFGTLKATVYSMLFAVPIALLGAIYTSEFVHRSVRSTVKPMMEMMEALPTVVLGFIGALILAPLVETWIAAVVLSFIVLPLGLVLAAYLWQLLPVGWTLRLDGLAKFGFMVATIVLLLWFAYLLGPGFQALFFAGDFKAWLNRDLGSATPFVFLLLMPLSYLAITWVFQRGVGPRYRDLSRNLPRQRAAVLALGRWLALFAGALLLAYLGARLLTLLGFDPRGSLVDTYVQRNALVVGFVMGFAVIPNIFTLAEDALSAVPDHLRAASLATGATPWQTAKWVILPTALSGVFAAVMIGMGRAVGETMIVVMAAGNTPILDWNIFNGLRTLSANIAVELPEAVQDSSLYRMLFLAALTLFVMTFAINTLAEVIRQRFRKRAFQL